LSYALCLLHYRTSVDGVDAVVEPALGKDTKKVFNLLKPLGTLIVCGG
jgi:hypothetical protein